MLASPEVGFIVPTTAMRRSGQNSVVAAKPTPVAIISAAAARSSKRRECRLAIQPTQSVISAVPIRAGDNSADRERIEAALNQIDRQQQGDKSVAERPYTTRSQNAQSVGRSSLRQRPPPFVASRQSATHSSAPPRDQAHSRDQEQAENHPAKPGFVKPRIQPKPDSGSDE